MAHDESYALVLAGGGAKGSYQIGAWKALREEGIRFHGIVGASVGALNAGLIATGSFSRAEDLWSSISFDRIVDIPGTFVKNGNLDLDIKNIQAFTRFVIKNKGLETRPLYRLIKEHLKEGHIRKSDVDIGVVSFNVSSFKPMEVFIDEIPEGMLARYLLASASFPLFKTVQIGGKKFTDGGVYDNIPFSMAKSRGYKRIIILDISGMGNNRRPHIAGTNTIYIKNSHRIGWELDFSQAAIQRSKLLGYLDTRKVFYRNTGVDYFILPDKKREKELTALLLADTRQNLIQKLLDDVNIQGDNYLARLRNALPPAYRHTRELGMAYLECAAKSLGIEKFAEYTMKDFINLVAAEYTALKEKTQRPSGKDFGQFMKLLKKRFDTLTEHKDLFDLNPAEYSRLGNMIFGRDEKHLRLKTLSSFFPELVAAKIMELLNVEDHRVD